MHPARLDGISPGTKGRRAAEHRRSFHCSSCRRISVGCNAPGVCRRISRRHRHPQIGRFAPAPFYKRHSLLGHFLSALLRNAENAPIVQRGRGPSGHPLRRQLRAPDSGCSFLSPMVGTTPNPRPLRSDAAENRLSKPPKTIPLWAMSYCISKRRPERTPPCRDTSSGD